MFNKDEILAECERLTQEKKRLNDLIFDVNTKLSGLQHIIEAYNLNPIPVSVATPLANYPLTGSITDKILFAVKTLNKPSSAIEIASYIAQYENVGDLKKFQAKINTYCSNLSKTVLSFEKQGKKYLYYIKEQ